MLPVRFFMVMTCISLPKCVGQVDGLPKGLRRKRAHRPTGRVRTPRGASAWSTDCFSQLFAGVTGGLHVPNLLHDLFQVVARRILQRRERNVALELLQPQGLADGQHVPVIDIGGGRRSKRPAHTEHGLGM